MNDKLTAELGAHAIPLVAGRVAAARVRALVADDVHHLRGAMGTAERRPLPRETEARALGAVRLLAAPVAHIDLPFPLVSAAKLRLLALRRTRAGIFFPRKESRQRSIGCVVLSAYFMKKLSACTYLSRLHSYTCMPYAIRGVEE